MTPAIAMLALVAATLGVFALCLTPALLEWRRPSDAEPLMVRRDQDTNIRHFARSFASQASELIDGHLAFEAEAAPGGRVEALWQDRDPLVYLARRDGDWLLERERQDKRVDRMVIAGTDLSLPPGVVFQQEIFVRGNLDADSGLTLRSAYATGRIVLGDDVVVARWVHADGLLRCGERGRLYGRASADKRIELGAGTEFERVSAPAIRFGTGPFEPRLPTPAAEGITAFEADEEAEWLDPQTLLLRRDHVFPPATRIGVRIVCRGSIGFGAGCIIEQPVKAWGELGIGPGSIARGALVARGDIELAAGTLGAGPVVTEGAIGIGAGCILGGPGRPSTVTARRIVVRPGAQISGTLWAGQSGRVEAHES